jgi:hypothetical protein
MNPTSRHIRSSPLALEDVRPSAVDLVIAVSGYEPRCTHLCAELRRLHGQEALRHLLLLPFKSHREAPSRREADAFYSDLSPKWTLEVTTDDGLAVRQRVRELLSRSSSESPLLLIDYTSMSRVLYLCLLDLLRDGVRLAFFYSVGRYRKLEIDFPISSVGSIRSVPGLEGLPYPSRQRLYVFGLGFDAVGTGALLDRLEAGRFVTYWADPGAFPEAAAAVTDQHEKIISRALLSFWTDLRDVQQTVRILETIAFESLYRDKVVFVPVGPKPQVLAAAIVATRHDHITLLAPHLEGGGMRDRIPGIEASGEIVGTLVEAAPQQP